MDDERLSRPHHVECCLVDDGPTGDNLCRACLDTLISGAEAEKALASVLSETPCSICGKTGYYAYDGPMYTA